MGSPYRPPCGGWPDLKSRPPGGCYQHTRKSEKHIQHIQNLTRVVDPAGNPAGIAPYMRVADDAGLPDGPECPGGCDPSAGPGNPPCGPWQFNGRTFKPTDAFSCDVGTTQISFNCYHTQGGVFDDLSRCRKVGFKNAQSGAWWDGRFGYMSHDFGAFAVQSTDVSTDGGATWHGGGCRYEPYQGSPDGTKYLTANLQTVITTKLYDTTGAGGGPGSLLETNVGTVAFQKTVNPTTGETVLDSCTDTTTGGSAPGIFPTPPWTELDAHGGFSSGFVQAVALSSYEGIAALVIGAGGAPWTLDACASDYTGCSISAHLTTGTGTYHASMAVDFTAGTFSYSVDSQDFPYGTTTRTIGWTNTGFVDALTEATSCGIEGCGDINFGEGPCCISTTIVTTGALSNPRYQTAVWAEVVGLLANIDLTDDKVYPWRLDTYCTIAPYVTRDRLPGPISPDAALDGCTVDDYRHPVPDSDGHDPTDPLWGPTWAQMTWFDPDFWLWVNADGTPYTGSATSPAVPAAGLVPMFTGNVLGKMNPAGSEGHFDWQHITTKCCPDASCAPGSGGSHPFEWGWGAKSGTEKDGRTVGPDPTDYVMPLCATQWTENSCIATDAYLPGAWMIYSSGYCVVQKWAEIKIHRPAINFAGPCGAQRFQADSTTTTCVVSVSGLTLTLSSPMPTPIRPSSLVVVNDGGSNAGLYSVASNIGTTLVLSAKLGAFPDGVSVPLNTVSAVLWPNAWSICGSLGIASQTTGGGTTAVVLSQPAPYLLTGDVVDFVDASDNAVVAGVSVVVTDETHIAFTGSANAGVYVRSHGAPHYWWFDTDSKGDYLLFNFTKNFRDIGEADRVCNQYCLLATEPSDDPGTPCGPPNPPVPGWITCNSPGGDCAEGATLRTVQAGRGMPREVSTMFVLADCLKFDPCNPQVVCISPNGESFNLGNTYGFSNTWTADSSSVTADSMMASADGMTMPASLDERYGAGWQGHVEFQITDPFWKSPPHSCPSCDGTIQPSACGQVEDDGGCDNGLGDCDDCAGGSSYYAQRNFVEARQDVPAAWNGDAAPSLPAGITLHIHSLDELNAGSLVAGVTVPPLPPPGGTCTGTGVWVPALSETAWTIWWNQVHCVCADGAFADNYKANGQSVHCP